jgi:hypothetical protein
MYLDDDGETDLDSIHDALMNADVLEGPEELYAIVEEFWPELVHKVKPPFSRMH